jgi:hypothetical protein
MLHKALITLIVLSLCSCGFRVIYRDTKNESEVSYTKELAAIRIKKDRSKLDQDLKNNLYDILNPDQLKGEPKYFLILSISESITPTFITITGSSGRNKITLTIQYTLKNLKNAETISSGHTSVSDNYNVTDNRYGSVTAENYLRSNLTKIASQNIRNSLVNDFIELKQRCEEAKSNNDEDFSCPL